MTMDVDVCAPSTPANLERLFAAVRELHPRFRDRPEVSVSSAAQLAGFRNVYLLTDFGALDVLGEITGVGDFEAVKAHSIEISLWGHPVRLLSLDALIDAKRALDRDKDRAVLRELELIRAKLREP